MPAETTTDGYLEGQLLIAMPTMGDERFERSVIYLCAHSAEGAMGIIVNKVLASMTFEELLAQLDIKAAEAVRRRAVHFGGPVDVGRGFVLHSAEVVREGTLVVQDGVAMTNTIDILREIAAGQGPRDCLLALGYAGWGPGQLEGEIQQNAWLNVGADPTLLFDPDHESKWQRAIAKIGVDVSMLSGTAGRA